jgi:hypothetical protein
MTMWILEDPTAPHKKTVLEKIQNSTYLGNSFGDVWKNLYLALVLALEQEQQLLQY